jgi:hypothetical protein
MATETTRTLEAGIAGRVADLVHSQPLLAVAAAGAVGVALGGVVFSRLGRFAFLAIAGYVVSDLWRREGHLDVQELLGRLSGERRRHPHS